MIGMTSARARAYFLMSWAVGCAITFVLVTAFLSGNAREAEVFGYHNKLWQWSLNDG